MRDTHSSPGKDLTLLLDDERAGREDVEESWAGSPAYEPRVSLQPTVQPWAGHVASLSLIVTFIEPCGW